jgi:hypothetical protein
MSEKNIPEAIAKKAWDSAQRLAMQIAALPPEARQLALQVTEQTCRDTADEFGLTAEERDGWIKIQMQLIRDVVKQIEASGSPQGGRA